MATSTDQPFIDFCGVRVFAAREGTRVRGRVEFPDGRSTVPMDYTSRRADASPRSKLIDKMDARASHRLSCLDKWERLVRENPEVPRTTLCARVGREEGVSVRTLQLWKRRHDAHGPDGLRDGYVAAPPSVLSMTADRAFDCVHWCAWWAFRVGNLGVIDNKAMVAASCVLATDGVSLADALVAVDCYFAWPCDRSRYPFKPLARWARYEFPKWLIRACHREDYRRAIGVLNHPSALDPSKSCEPRAPQTRLAGARADFERSRDREGAVLPCATAVSAVAVPLLAPTRVIDSDAPDANERRRAASNRGTRRSMLRLAGGAPVANPPATPNNIDAARRAKKLMGEGFVHAAMENVARVDGGLPALASVTAPGTMAEALAALRDDYRMMLFAASRGDRTAFEEAVATLPLWYDRMPEETRWKVERLPGLRRTFRNTEQGSRRAVELVLEDVRAFKGGGILAAAKRLALE